VINPYQDYVGYGKRQGFPEGLAERTAHKRETGDTALVSSDTREEPNRKEFPMSELEESVLQRLRAWS
jgi:hypothetical protein